MVFVIEYDLLWHWKLACPSQKTSTCFRKDKCATINLLIRNICSINKKAFIDFTNSKTMSTLCQANYCTVYWSLWYVCNGEWELYARGTISGLLVLGLGPVRQLPLPSALCGVAMDSLHSSSSFGGQQEQRVQWSRPASLLHAHFLTQSLYG